MENIIAPARHLIFVYGSLKSGYWNNQVMSRDGGTADLVGRAVTMDKFFLFDGPFPFMAKKPVGMALPKTLRKFKGTVVGEAYYVNDVGLANCDRLEGHPRFYRREPTPVSFFNGELPSRAWAYFIQRWPGVQSLIAPNEDGDVEWTTKSRDSDPEA